MTMNLEDILVFRIDEDHAIAATSYLEAVKWYIDFIGLTEEWNEADYVADTIEVIPRDYTVQLSPLDDSLMTINELLHLFWKGEPTLLFTTSTIPVAVQAPVLAKTGT